MKICTHFFKDGNRNLPVEQIVLFVRAGNNSDKILKNLIIDCCLESRWEDARILVDQVRDPLILTENGCLASLFKGLAKNASAFVSSFHKKFSSLLKGKHDQTTQTLYQQSFLTEICKLLDNKNKNGAMSLIESTIDSNPLSSSESSGKRS